MILFIQIIVLIPASFKTISKLFLRYNILMLVESVYSSSIVLRKSF